MAHLEFFFDLSSPWTYLAFTNVEGVVGRAGATITYRPILVGGVFNAVNPAVYAARESGDNPRFRHSWKVLKDWARLAGVTMHFPNQYHPAKSVHAMRMATALESDQKALRAFAKAAFEGFFGGEKVNLIITTPGHCQPRRGNQQYVSGVVTANAENLRIQI